MNVERDRIPHLVSIFIVKRLRSGTIITITVNADLVCLRLHEVYRPRRVAVGPSHVVEAHHISHLFPSPNAQRAWAKVGGFEFKAVIVPLLVSFGEQLCMVRV